MDNFIRTSILDQVGIPKFRKYLDLTALRHKLIAGNISNVMTPGYQSKDIEFHKEFQKLTSQSSRLEPVMTHPRHIPVGDDPRRGPKVVVDKNAESNGINDVNIDKEMTTLSVNQMSYTVAARLIKKKFDGLRSAITGQIR